MEPWIENLWPALQSFLGVEGRQKKEQPEEKQEKEQPDGKQDKKDEGKQKGEPDLEIQTHSLSSEDPPSSVSNTLVNLLNIPKDAKMSLPPLPAPYLNVVMHGVQPVSGELGFSLHVESQEFEI